MLSLHKSASSPGKAMRCLPIALVLVAAAAFTTPKTTRGGLVLSTTKPAALLSTATLQEEAVVVNSSDDKMPPKLALALVARETQTETALLDADDLLALLERPGQPVPAKLKTDADIVLFEDAAFEAGVLTTLRVAATAWDASWALDHHNGVVQYHSDGRKRALVLPPIERITDMVHNKLVRGRPLNGPLEEATKDWLELVCVSPTSLELKAPFNTLAKSYDYCPDGDGGRMAISAPAALIYKTNQFMACWGFLPDFIQEAAACFFAENSLAFRAEVGMGNPLALGDESELRLVNFRAKDSWVELVANGLETGFKGYLVMGMCGPHYRRWAHDHGLPDARVIDWSSLGADDFSRRDGAERSEAFQKIFDTCLAHGTLGSGDEEILRAALYNLSRSHSDLIEALEILNVVAVGDGTFEMRGSERVAIKVKSWPADLPVAEELRNALAPTSMGVAAFLGACKFVPVPDSAQIKSRHRRVDATHWSICAQVPPEAHGKLLYDPDRYVPGRFLNEEGTARLTVQNDPARGLIHCHGCDMKRKPVKGRNRRTGTQCYVCGVCRQANFDMITLPTGDYVINYASNSWGHK